MAFTSSGLFGQNFAKTLAGAADMDFDGAGVRADLFIDTTYAGNIDAAADLAIGDLTGVATGGGYATITPDTPTLAQVADADIEYKLGANPVFTALTLSDLGGIVFWDTSAATPVADLCLCALKFDAVGSSGGGDFTVNLTALTIFTLDPQP